MKQWLPKTALRVARLLLLCAALAWCVGPGQAQTAIPANAQLVAPSAIPKFGTFVSLYKTKEPPLPFLKPMYAEAGLPVYWLGGNRFLVDDTSLDWAAIQAERRLLQAAAAMSANSLSLLDGGGAGLMGCNYSSNDLWLEINAVTNQTVALTVHTPVENGAYDIYFLPNLNWQRWQWRRVICGLPGQTDFVLPMPEPQQGYFVALDAADDDGDGLGNGYECWFNYNGRYTSPTNWDTDGDGLADGWEVQYGLDPTSTAGVNGAGSDSDGDQLNNAEEYGLYSYMDGNYDPLSNFYTQASRPVVSVSLSRSSSCDRATITFSRYGDYNQPLDVYYAVGGDLHYGTDYSLVPPPAGLPRILSIRIPAQYVTAAVEFALLPGSVATGQRTRFAVALTPYGVAAEPQVPTPADWAYVVDIHQGHDHAEFEVQFDHLKPAVYATSATICPGSQVTIRLEGDDGCQEALTFEVVTNSGPSHGALGGITQHGTYAEVIYTPTNGYCGPDAFAFRAKGRILYSDPASVAITVGPPSPPLAHCQTVLTPTNTPPTITLSGSDEGCGGNLIFTITDPPASGTGSLGPVTQHGTNATVTYTPPSATFEGMVTFSFKVTNNCGEDSTPERVVVGVTPPPTLAIECRRNRLLLSWSVPDWIVNNGLLSEFRIYRCEAPSSDCTPGQAAYHTVDAIADPALRFFVDENVATNTRYCYAGAFAHADACHQPPVTNASPHSPAVCAQTCEPPVAPTDVVFVVDNTYSVDLAIMENIKAGIAAALDDIEAASTTGTGTDYRLALITPDNDQVHVRVTFAQNNRSAFEVAVAMLPDWSDPFGNYPCESTDECILTAIRGRSSTDSSLVVPSMCVRPIEDPSVLQLGSFTPAFARARKLIVLITDRPPGGFCDPAIWEYDPLYHGAHARAIADEAQVGSMRINAVQIPASYKDLFGVIVHEMDQQAASIMLYYSTRTCGWYSDIPPYAITTLLVRERILRMIYAPIAPCP